MTDHAQIAEHYTGTRTFDARGAMVAFVTCRRCGVALMLDDSDPFDPTERHEAFHVLPDSSRSWLIDAARVFMPENPVSPHEGMPATDVAGFGGKRIHCELQPDGVWMLTDADDRTYLGEFAA